MDIQDAIDWLGGMVGVVPAGLAKDCNSVIKLLKALQNTGREVVKSVQAEGNDFYRGSQRIEDAAYDLNKVLRGKDKEEDEEEDFGAMIDRLIEHGETDEEIFADLNEDERGMLVSLIRVRLQNRP